MNWLVDAPAVGARVVRADSPSRAPRARAEIVRLDGDEIELALDEPVSAITPGQSLVIYDGERVLGGGLIERGRCDCALRRCRVRAASLVLQPTRLGELPHRLFLLLASACRAR